MNTAINYRIHTDRPL